MTDALSDESFRPWRALAREFGYRSIVSAPLVVQGEVPRRAQRLLGASRAT